MKHLKYFKEGLSGDEIEDKLSEIKKHILSVYKFIHKIREATFTQRKDAIPLTKDRHSFVKSMYGKIYGISYAIGIDKPFPGPYNGRSDDEILCGLADWLDKNMSMSPNSPEAYYKEIFEYPLRDFLERGIGFDGEDMYDMMEYFEILGQMGNSETPSKEKYKNGKEIIKFDIIEDCDTPLHLEEYSLMYSENMVLLYFVELKFIPDIESEVKNEDDPQFLELMEHIKSYNDRFKDMGLEIYNGPFGGNINVDKHKFIRFQLTEI